MALSARCWSWTAREARSRLSPGPVSALVAVVGAAGIATATISYGPPQVAGELIVDLDYSTLFLGSDTWQNHATSEDSVGDFVSVDGGPLSIATNVSVENGVVYRALDVRGVAGNSLISLLPTPTSLEGNSTRSVEAWVLATESTYSSVAGWGQRDREQLSDFRFATGGNGMFAGFFNDAGWDDATIVTDNVGKLTHLAWTYDSDTVAGYVNGILSGNRDILDLDTAGGLLKIGAGSPDSRDPFNGYIAAVRVHTGALSPEQVMHNSTIPCCLPPPPVCNFDGDSDCDSADFAILIDNLFTSKVEDGTVLSGDWDGDSDVDLVDYRGMKGDWRRVLGVHDAVAASSSEAPEPASCVCLMIAVTALIAWTQR